MVIENTVEGAVHTIIDIVHQSPIRGPFVFLCDRSKQRFTKKSTLRINFSKLALLPFSKSRMFTVRG